MIRSTSRSSPRFSSGLAGVSGAPQAAQQAHGLLYGLVQQQATYQAFMAVFGWSALAVLVTILTPLLMKKVINHGEVQMH